jgi:predicted lipoprotein with Yx(FWY)xxD motif
MGVNMEFHGGRTRMSVYVSAAAALAVAVPVGGAVWVAHAAGPVQSSAASAGATSHDAAAGPTRSPGSDEDAEAGPPPPALTVAVRPAAFGHRLSNGAGKTVYVFSKDRPNEPTCTGACSSRWLPVRSQGGKPQPGQGAHAPAIGNVLRPDGSEQVTFRGHPLYYFVRDKGPGEAHGQGRNEFGGGWSAVPPVAASSLKAPAQAGANVKSGVR